MPEIYRGTSNTVHLDIQGGETATPPTATYINLSTGATGILDVTAAEAPNENTQRWQATLGLNHTQSPGTIEVDWAFTIDDDAVIKSDFFDVVVPLVTLGRIRDELELDASTSDDTIAQVERRVRRIIERVTGQVFAPHTGERVVYPTNDRYLRLPRRLVSLASVKLNGYSIPLSTLVISEDGWRLSRRNPYLPGDIYPPGIDADDFSFGGVITDPYSWVDRYWKGRSEITIDGVWGWKYVPEAIREAALILIEERLCPESIYRDRYLKTMTAADWRIEFSPGAYAGTGNVLADQILDDFRSNHMAVV